jgi:hypothetical protein
MGKLKERENVKDHSVNETIAFDLRDKWRAVVNAVMNVGVQ